MDNVRTAIIANEALCYIPKIALMTKIAEAE
jgi:hypothetical protein